MRSPIGRDSCLLGRYRVTTSRNVQGTLSSGGSHTCGLRANGQADCWGRNGNGQSTPPRDQRFILISSGGSHTCALDSNRYISCWGRNSDGQIDPPQGQQLSWLTSGQNHTCGLDSDGTPVCWGSIAPHPADATTFAALSSGGSHVCGLSGVGWDNTPEWEGELICWGDSEAVRNQPGTAAAYESISSGGTHTCALETDGTPVCWGSDGEGQA